MFCLTQSTILTKTINVILLVVIIPTEALERITKTVYYTAAAPDGTFKLRMETSDPFQLWAARGREATSDDYDLKLVVNSSGLEVNTEWSYEVYQTDANATFIHIFGGKGLQLSVKHID